MPRFTYTAVDTRGSEKRGELEATDSKQAIAVLRDQGFFPTQVRPVANRENAKPLSRKSLLGHEAIDSRITRAKASGRALKTPLRIPFTKAVAPRELAGFTRQLSTLLRAGMPLLKGVEVLARQERNPAFKTVIEGIAESIRSGGSLSDAMAVHATVFDRLYLNMIKAGEASGALDVVLDRLARFQEKSLQLKAKIKSAMIYPLIVMIVALVILVGLLVLVVPKFKQIFADLLKGAPLPPLTQFVLTASDLVKDHFLIVGGILAAIVIVLKRVAKTARGAWVIDHWRVRVPGFGPLFLKGIIARFGRTLGTLLSSGVPILQALVIARDTCGNARVAAAITEVHDQVKAGSPVARPLEAAAVFPPMVTSMIEVGEHTGQLPEMLNKIADTYEDEVDTAVAGLSSMIEPVLILFLAVVVGTIVIALFLPIIRIVQLLT
jgi:type IV pilus assembly protein PilC